MSNFIIRLYEDRYKADFVRLNTEWITTFFRLEDSDTKVLNNVESYILDKGGQIFLAVSDDDEVLGCCALIVHPENETYELAKMAVTPSAQGLGIGRKLGEVLLTYAKCKGIKQVFLEGNTKMVASISLYRKLGFVEVPKQRAAYERCDIMMVADL